MIKIFNSLFVTMLGLGKIRFIPGTFGSLATTIILYILFHILLSPCPHIGSNKSPFSLGTATATFRDDALCQSALISACAPFSVRLIRPRIIKHVPLMEKMGENIAWSIHHMTKLGSENIKSIIIVNVSQFDQI